jgi:hypothetical protein
MKSIVECTTLSTSARRADFRRALAWLALCLLGALTQLAVARDPVVSPIALVGRWTASAPHPDGEMRVSLSINQNLRFTGSASIEGRPLWDFGGRLELAGGQLVWRYEASSIPLPDAMKTDVDDIVSLDASELVLLSRRTGKQRTFRRLL